METTLNGFSKDFMGLVKENAIENQVSIEQQLTEDIIEYIKEEGFAYSPELLYCINKACAKTTAPDFYKINAFDYSDDSGILDIFVTNYIESEDVPELTKARIESSLNNAMHFLTKSVESESFANSLLDEEPDAAEIADLIFGEFKAGHVSLIRFFILSNGVKKVEFSTSLELTLGTASYDAEVHVWDMEMVRRSEIASRSEGAIDIDFANYYNHPIECLEVDESEGVKSYLAIMPAIILAKVFGEYKARLLDQNVRNYLGGKITVNKNMLATLRKTPGLFFAYNNGISSTANSVTATRDEESGKTIVTNIRNWQIVNGGQTTNTIYTIYKQDPSLLEKAFVTMKLSEIRISDTTERDQTISNIAKYANSQTQIKDSDLSANIPYMLNVQNISRAEWAPATSSRKNTKWYFERLRGQYEYDAGDKKTRKYKEFIATNPKKTQKFGKTDIAKWELSWRDEPYSASKGGELCYDAFFREYLKNNSIEVDRAYFHDLIAKAIIYKSIGTIVKTKGGYAYPNIVSNYVMATIAAKSRNQFDLEYVWDHQEIHPDLKEYIEKAADIVSKYTTLISQNGENPATKAKKQAFWKEVLLRMANMPELPKSLIRVRANELSDAQQKLVSRFNEININVWKDLATWGKSTKKLSLAERKRVDHIVSYLDTDREVTVESAMAGLEILDKSKDLGFVIQFAI